jgi:hypothetical protein
MSIAVHKDYRPVVNCPDCQKLVSGRVLHSYAVRDDELMAPGEYLFYLLVSCPTCRRPFLLSRIGIESSEWDQCPDEWHEPSVLYPSSPKEMDPTVPKPLADSYLEACRTYEVQAYVSCAIMCRRVLEGICVHFKAKGRSLFDKLSDLKAQGIVDARLYEWSNEALRALGNEAAHDVTQTVNNRDAKDALDFTKAILEYLFIFAAAFESFKKRRERKSKEEIPPEPPSS